MRKILRVVIFISSALLVFAGCKKDNGIDQAPYEQLGKDTLAIKSYLGDSIPAVQHKSGIYYQIKNPGRGNTPYFATTVVKAKYTGKILGSNVPFDSGTSDFQLGRVITGWQIGLQLIQKGGKIRLIIPSGYAYGASSTGEIPPNSILDFEVELLDVTN
jgi:FKBP-type peptidyl-prolyl cis-trans isomerase FkpA